MAYPDNHRLLSELFGENTAYTTGSNTYTPGSSGATMGGDGYLHIDIKQLPEVTDHTTITPTGIVLALIKALHANQGVEEDRKIVVQNPTRLIATREGISSLRERFSVDFWDNWATGHDPDDI